MRRILRILPAALALAPAAVYLLTYLHYRLPAPRLITGAEADRAIHAIRAAVDGRPAPGASGMETESAGPIWITLYQAGAPLLQHQAARGTLAAAVRDAERVIRSAKAIRDLGPEARAALRIKLDVTVGEGPILATVPILFASGVVPGRDGLGLSVGDRTAYLLPDETVKRDLFSGYDPFWFMAEFRTGLDLRGAVDLLAERLQLSADAWRASRKRYFRFRTQAFVESLDRARALPVDRTRVVVDGIDRRQLREALVRAADYVVRQARPDGSYEYIYYPFTNSHSSGEYSLPRHCGTTWFLALAYRVLGEARYREGARAAIEYLAKHAVPAGCERTPYACIGTAREGDLGSAALGIVAIAEYQRATGDRRFEPLARRLGKFLLWMQKENGDFCHQYEPASAKRNCKEMLLYYSGEAALGLAKLWELTRDPVYVKPLERALDFLTVENYDFFLGQFFIGEDHWTCIAADTAFDAGVDKPEYARFCYAFAELNARAQYQVDEGPVADLHGAFGITPWFMPHNTPAGSRTEANVASYLLSVKRKEPQPQILRSVRMSLRYLIDQQIRPESAYLFPRPELAVGGMMQTPVRGNIRIDFVQHAAAAMARAIELVPEERWRP